jgi:MinD superfamily P-loop ATPase
MKKIAISSGKGGTGKTTVATNLSAYLAEEIPIALVDLDVEEPNSGIFFKNELVHNEIRYKNVPDWLEDRCVPCNICKDVCNFNAIIRLGDQIIPFPELCHSCYACVELCPEKALVMRQERIGVLNHYRKDNLDFIEGILDIGTEQPVPLISQTIRYADNAIDENILKIYDTPPGTSCPVIEGTKNADLVLLVTEPTPFGFHDIKLSIEAMRVLKRPIAVIINRDGIGNDDTEKYCKKENIEVIAKFPNQRKIAELYSNGELIYKQVTEFKAELDKVVNYIREHLK